jgi:hypothetical protein
MHAYSSRSVRQRSSHRSSASFGAAAFALGAAATKVGFRRESEHLGRFGGEPPMLLEGAGDSSTGDG